MTSTFGTLYTVRSGLDAARRALDVVGQNVSNANTVGYSRQEVSNVAADPGHVINSAGRGVSEVNVVRYREEFLDRQWRSRAGSQSYYDTRSSMLGQLEGVVGDLSEGGLRTALDNFFNSWDNLASHPSQASARTQVVSNTADFLSQAQAVFNNLKDLRMGVDENLQTKVQDLNNAAQQLAELNKQITAAETNPQKANELRDRRDLLVDSMAKLAGVTAATQADGTVTVNLGAYLLVDRNQAYTIDASYQQESAGARQTLSVYTWNGTSNPVTFAGGELGALQELRDTEIPNQMKYLDNLVRTVAANVNAAHTAGVPAASQVNIFNIQSTDYMDIVVNPAVQGDPNQILAAATLPASASDGDRALGIARMRDSAILTGEPMGTRTVTAGEYMQSVSTMLGMQVAQATQRSQTAALVMAQADKQRQSVSGVSLDDEMTKMIQFQQAYNAAARIMTTVDEMLDTVVNRVGLVGR